MGAADHVIGNIEELRTLYREPTAFVRRKKFAGIDAASRALVESSPFVLVGTCGVDGGVDVSPRGGDPGFVRVLDDVHLAIPDLNGNNLLDSYTAVVQTGRAGLLFVLPGRDETLRVNGAAWLTTDPDVLGSFEGIRTPKAALVVRADEVFVHCGKSFRRGRVWDTTSWTDLTGVPGLEAIVCAQGLVDVPAEVIRADLERSYAADLALDRPTDE